MSDVAWQPSASIELLQRRALYFAKIRQFFTDRGYWEVETPIMAQYGSTDVYLSNIKAQFRGKTYSLQTSPEYHMKRLLAAGSGPIFQLSRVFRDDELGRWHNPEFTLLEWYQLGIDHFALMDEMDLFLQAILNSKPMVRKTYREVFAEIVDCDPFLASIDTFKTILEKHQLQGILPGDEEDRDQYLFLLMSHVIEPALAAHPTPVAVYHFPASQSALAKVTDDYAERFEIYYKGVELANGFHELTDHAAQATRFATDQTIRETKGLPEVAADVYLLEALKQGLPACSGVALGVDRLLALAFEQAGLGGVLAFDFGRA